MRPWQWIVLGILALIVATGGAAFAWYASDADLRWIRAEADRRGFPLDRPAWHPSPARARVDAMAKRLGGKRLEAMAWYGRPEPASSLDALRTQEQAAIGRAVADDLLAIPEDLIGANTGPVLEQLIERILVAPPDDLGSLVAASARCVNVANTYGQRYLLTAIAVRLGDVPSGSTVPATLRALARSVREAATAARDPADLRLMYEMWCRQGLTSSPRLFARFERRAVADSCFAWWDFMARGPGETAIVAHVRALRDATTGRSHVLPFMSGDEHFAWMVRTVAERIAHGALAEAMAALIDGAPLPSDPLDTSGGTMRVLRDGASVVGAYSVGLDDHDDSGSVRSDVVVDARQAPIAR